MWFVSEVGLLVVCSMGVMSAKDKKKEKKEPKVCGHRVFFPYYKSQSSYCHDS